VFQNIAFMVNKKGRRLAPIIACLLATGFWILPSFPPMLLQQSALTPGMLSGYTLQDWLTFSQELLHFSIHGRWGAVFTDFHIYQKCYPTFPIGLEVRSSLPDLNNLQLSHLIKRFILQQVKWRLFMSSSWHHLCFI